VLRQRQDVRQSLSQGRVEIIDLRGVGAQAAEDTDPRRSADGLLAVRAFKQQALAGEAVDVGRNDLLFAVAVELRAQVVNGDKQDVGFVDSGGSDKCRHGGGGSGRYGKETSARKLLLFHHHPQRTIILISATA